MSETSGGAPSAPSTAAPAASNAAPPSGQQEAPSTSGGTQVATGGPPSPRRFKVVDNGREEELGADDLVERLVTIHGEDGIRSLGSLSSATRRKLTELATSKKQIEEALSDLRDPRKAFALVERMHGRDAARRMVEEWYAQDVEERNLDPRTREQRQKLSDLERRERALEARERKAQEAQVAERAAQLQPQLGRMFADALKRSGAETPTPIMAAKMARIVEEEIAAAQSAGQRVTDEDFRSIVADAARVVASGHYTEIEQDFPRLPEAKRMALVAGVLKAMPPAQLAEFLGVEGLRAFRRWDVEQHKAKQAAAKPIAQPQQQRPRDPSTGQYTSKPKTHIDDWLREKW